MIYQKSHLCRGWVLKRQVPFNEILMWDSRGLLRSNGSTESVRDISTKGSHQMSVSQFTRSNWFGIVSCYRWSDRSISNVTKTFKCCNNILGKTGLEKLYLRIEMFINNTNAAGFVQLLPATEKFGLNDQFSHLNQFWNVVVKLPYHSYFIGFLTLKGSTKHFTMMKWMTSQVLTCLSWIWSWGYSWECSWGGRPGWDWRGSS